MRKLLIIIAILVFSIGTHAQERNMVTADWQTTSLDSVPTIIANLLSKCDRNFVLYGSDLVKTNKPRRFEYRYKGASSERPDSVKLIVHVEEKMIGANPNLEIPGTPVYEIKSFAGKMLDLACIWDVLNPGTKETIVKITSDEQCKFTDHNGQTRRYTIKKNPVQYSDLPWVLQRTW